MPDTTPSAGSPGVRPYAVPNHAPARPKRIPIQVPNNVLERRNRLHQRAVVDREIEGARSQNLDGPSWMDFAAWFLNSVRPPAKTPAQLPGAEDAMPKQPPRTPTTPPMLTDRAGYNQVFRAAQAGHDAHPEIVAAQWAQETGWGHRPGPGNSYFGIKGPGATTLTREVINGRSVPVRASFRGYPTWGASVADRVRLTENRRYTQAGYGKTGTQAGLDALQRAGYATDPKYAEHLRSIITKMGRWSPQ